MFISNRMKFGCAGYDSIDFYNFFHMFLRTYVTNLRECLVEWLILAMDESGDTSSSVSLSSLNLSTRSSIANGNGPITPFDMLPGEIMTFAPKERVYWTVYCSKNMKEPYFTPGLLYLTNYRIVLTSSKKLPPVHQSKHSKYDVPAYFNLMSLPYAAVHKLTVGNPHNSIYISCKDYRQVRLTISGFENNRGKAETFFQFLHSLSFYMTSSTPPGSVTITNTGMTLDGVKNHLFAYKYTPSFKRTGTNAWNLSDMVKEYVREGLYDASEWKVSLLVLFCFYLFVIQSHHISLCLSCMIIQIILLQVLIRDI